MKLWSSENPHFLTKNYYTSKQLMFGLEYVEEDWLVFFFFEGILAAIIYHNEILVSFIDQMNNEELLTGYFGQGGATAYATRLLLKVL